ncbi:hypothetical protein MANES_02G006040v8 [Manihot esculenta]|uniref:Uncharacterized protein n=1 Tax=Manihot esculenta TaxID=3983 RepID=A0ACB7I491_MANES|nr:hypothetical protein MANES_02G006040v8 [Manihot esculenta]
MLENKSDKQPTAPAIGVRETKRRKATPYSPSKSISEVRNNSSPSSNQLPVKSLIRFRCVSKFCSITISHPSFVTVHQPYPRPKPGLLFTCATRLQLAQTFFAATASQNGGPATCCLIVPPRFSRYTTQSVNGIVCMDFGICATICNPSTRQAISLPFLCPKTSIITSNTYFCVNVLGFNPNNKQYKVLNSWGNYNLGTTEYRVFTLGTRKWRRVHGGPAFFAQRESICIGGIIFFRSWTTLGTNGGLAVLVSFDVQTESFRVINLPRGAPYNVATSSLIQLKGRLIIADYQIDSEGYCLWVVEDYWNEIWTQHYVFFPLCLKKTITGHNVIVSGSIDTGEIIMAPQCLSAPFTPFYVYYCNLSRGHFISVKIFGLPDYDAFDTSSNNVAITNYVENILPLS